MRVITNSEEREGRLIHTRWSVDRLLLFACLLIAAAFGLPFLFIPDLWTPKGFLILAAALCFVLAGVNFSFTRAVFSACGIGLQIGLFVMRRVRYADVVYAKAVRLPFVGMSVALGCRSGGGMREIALSCRRPEEFFSVLRETHPEIPIL